MFRALAPSTREVLRQIQPARYRCFTTETPAIHHEELDAWIAQPKQFTLSDTLHPERVSDLFITIPSRDGTRKPFHEPKKGRKLPPGFEIAFFHFRTPETELRRDGTDGEFCPPNPFSRRMWASGKMTWDIRNPLLLGEKVDASWTVDSVQKKGFETGNPMLFVNKKIDYTMVGKASPSLVEERVHVYLPDSQVPNRAPREGMLA